MDCLNSTPTPRLILQLWRHIGSVRRKQFVLLALLTFISALAEVVSLGAVLPFIGILVAPEDVFNHEYLKPVWAFVGLKIKSACATSHSDVCFDCVDCRDDKAFVALDKHEVRFLMRSRS